MKKKVCLFVYCFTLSIWAFLIFFSTFPNRSEASTQNEKSLEHPVKKRVLVLNSYHMGFKWSDDIMEAIRDAFASDAPGVELYFEYLDTKRFPDRDYWRKIYSALISKYKGLSFNLIMTSDNNALEFILKFRSPYFSDVPIVFCGVNYFKPKDIEGHDSITGIAEQFNLKGTIDLALQLRPETTELDFIVGPLSIKSHRLNLEQIQRIIPQFKDRLKIEILQCSTMKEGEAKVRRLPSSAAIFFLGRLTDSEGKLVTPIKQSQRLSEISNAPIYTVWDFYLGSGPVGGLMLNGADQGKAAVVMAIRILKGTPAHEIPVLLESPSSYMLDYVQMKHFGIKTNALPENSLIINQPISFYEKHQKMVWAVLTFFAVSILLITLLAINVFKRMRVERKLREHRAQLEEKVKERTLQLDNSNRSLKDDIARRKQAEETLRESERKYKTLIEAVPDMVWEFDENEIFTFCSQSYKEILGYDPEELVGKSAYSIMPEAEPGKVKAEFGKIKSERRPFRDLQNYNFTKNGELRYCLSSGVPIISENGDYKGYRGIDKDITEYKGTEEALKESEGRYRTILENVLVGVYQVTLDGKFIFANQKMIEILGYSSYEELNAIGSIAEIYARPEERTKLVDEIMSKGFINDEFEYRRKDGRNIWVKLHTRKTKNKEGAIILEGLMEDVTAVKNMEAQLLQSQKMEAIGTLAGGIAHDFNNILAIILGNTELASDDVPEWNPASQSLKAIHQASLRAKDMVKQLLAFSRKSNEDSKPLNMAPIIKESLKMLRSAVPTSVEFKQNISDDACNVMGEATQINQIVMNLVTNAADAMSEEGGLLELILENITLQEEKSCFDWVLCPGKYVRLKVRDTGEGIEPTIIDRIFEPYYTTKEVGKGTGMGLSVIHGIVKRHNGGIRVESELGKGTVFEIYFPALEEMREEEKEPEGEIKGGSESILFVDDEESLVNLNRQRLERLGYQVKSTTKPLQALEWFSADPDQFDVIVTDMAMPRMTGDRLTKEILTIRPQMPVIICTGYSERMSEKKAEALGVRKYIEKPIDTGNLAAALREVLEEN